MNQSSAFNLDRQLDDWLDSIRDNPAYTASDLEELKNHFYEITDSLTESGLDEEEAFVVAKMRLDIDSEVDKEFRDGNKPIIQMRRSLLILAGVIVYFLLYYLILSTSKLLIISLRLSEINYSVSVDWVFRYLLSWHFVIVVFFTSVYFLENKIINFIEKLKIKPRSTIFLLSATAFFAILDTCLYPVAKNMLDNNISILSSLFLHYRNFDFSFPLIIGLGFIFIYYKYHKKSNFSI